MNKIKDFIGQAVFLISAMLLSVSMNWISEEKSKIAAIDAVIDLGKSAETVRSRWNTLTEN